MTIAKMLLLAGLLTSAVALTGCPGDGSHRAAATRPGPSVTVSPGKTHDVVSRPAPSGGRPPRESFLSTYRNPEEGITFRYPRYYALEEGEVEEHSYFLKRQEELDIEQPGTRLVATLLIPEDGYPNTTFEHGSLQLLVQDSGTAENCQPPSNDSEYAAKLPKTQAAQNIVFRGIELKYETGGTQVYERDYAGFGGGACYQFSLVVAVEAAPDPEGINKPADAARIIRQLEKIVGSMQIQERRAIPRELRAESASRL